MELIKAHEEKKEMATRMSNNTHMALQNLNQSPKKGSVSLGNSKGGNRVNLAFLFHQQDQRPRGLYSTNTHEA